MYDNRYAAVMQKHQVGLVCRVLLPAAAVRSIGHVEVHVLQRPLSQPRADASRRH